MFLRVLKFLFTSRGRERQPDAINIIMRTISESDFLVWLCIFTEERPWSSVHFFRDVSVGTCSRMVRHFLLLFYEVHVFAIPTVPA